MARVIARLDSKSDEAEEVSYYSFEVNGWTSKLDQATIFDEDPRYKVVSTTENLTIIEEEVQTGKRTRFEFHYPLTELRVLV